MWAVPHVKFLYHARQWVPALKRPAREEDRSPQRHTAVEGKDSKTSTLPYAFTTCTGATFFMQFQVTHLQVWKH